MVNSIEKGSFLVVLIHEQFPMRQDKMVVQSCYFFTLTATTTRREKDAKIQSIAGRRLEYY